MRRSRRKSAPSQLPFSVWLRIIFTCTRSCWCDELCAPLADTSASALVYFRFVPDQGWAQTLASSFSSIPAPISTMRQMIIVLALWSHLSALPAGFLLAGWLRGKAKEGLWGHGMGSLLFLLLLLRQSVTGRLALICMRRAPHR